MNNSSSLRENMPHATNASSRTPENQIRRGPPRSPPPLVRRDGRIFGDNDVTATVSNGVRRCLSFTS
tara:strand:- start:250 stop:450 length:201 start_codon:yes stop_codon:yes gene_type:complete